jgi:hypothetical protein
MSKNFIRVVPSYFVFICASLETVIPTRLHPIPSDKSPLCRLNLHCFNITSDITKFMILSLVERRNNGKIHYYNTDLCSLRVSNTTISVIKMTQPPQ